MNIFMLPMSSELGIGQVVTAYRKYLPAYGITFVANESAADLIVMHAAEHAKVQADVVHCHGLYPTAVEDAKCDVCKSTNAAVIDNLRHALRITVPSDWVAQILRRDMNLQPEVMPHGITLSDWHFVTHAAEPFVLWAKGHAPGVVDTALVNQLAERLPDVQFVSTFGKTSANVRVVGKQSFERMQQMLQNAGVYLATTKETFGIQTLEAMACGVPVVGYDIGATPELVTHGHDGYLSAMNDLDGLVAGVKWALEHQASLRINARRTAEKHDWLSVADRLHALYESVLLEKAQANKQTYSIVIPCHNYAQLLPEAIQSAKQQQGVSEIIVVDDASTDGVEALFEQHKDVKFIRLAKNVGVARARNLGVQQAKGTYITCLDADDALLPNFAQDLLPAIKADRSLGIVYGGLIVKQAGRQTASDWPGNFDYHVQANSGHNCVPSANIFRKAAWARAGGYRTIYQPAEDAELWLKIASVGYDVRKVTDKPVYVYNLHPNSLSATHRQPDYKADKPWHKLPELTPCAAPGGKPAWDVRNYDQPWVSVIIPVADYHAGLAWRAIESVMYQSMPYWEVIVVNTSDQVLSNPFTGLPLGQAYRFATVLQVRPGASPSIARNAGAAVARAPLLVFLDADDQLDQHYLRVTLNEFNAQAEPSYVYTDWRNQDHEIIKAAEFDCDHLKLESFHPVTALVPKAWHTAVGGFDETIAGWEDWDYYLRLAAAKHCGVRVPQALMTYDYQAGKRRYDSLDKKTQLLPIIRERYKAMACSSCGGKRIKQAPPNVTMQPLPNRGVPSMAQSNQSGHMVRVMINDGNQGMHGVNGLRTRIDYGMHKTGEVIQMHIDDQRAKPQHYVIQVEPEPELAQIAMPSAPLFRNVNDNLQLVTIEPTEPITAPVVAAVPIAESVQQEEGIDLSILSLPAIKRLDWDAESARDALEAERLGSKRKNVIAFFEEFVQKHPVKA